MIRLSDLQLVLIINVNRIRPMSPQVDHKIHNSVTFFKLKKIIGKQPDGNCTLKKSTLIQ